VFSAGLNFFGQYSECTLKSIGVAVTIFCEGHVSASETICWRCL